MLQATPTPDRDQEANLDAALLRLNARAWGISFGLLFGLALFVATLVLVVRGGPVVGPHLALLGNFLPGYRVTVGGAFIGFIYLFVIGYGFGRLVGETYNYIVRPRA